MASIVGIPTTRVSDLFISKQMLGQVQQSMLALYKTETQLSTGHAFQVASENPVAAMNVISLQSLLERKGQVNSNLGTTLSFLTMTDNALSNVSTSMADVRGTALSVIGTTASDTQRRSVAIEVSEALSQMVDTGNQTFRGRYLFAGSTTGVLPFVTTASGLVEYVGNEEELSSYCNIDSLYSSSVSGSQVFGAISEAIQGTAQLTAAFTSDSKLAELNNGDGVRLGSIDVQVGLNSYTVDLSNATTVEDVAQMIYDQTDNKVKVHAGSEGLVLDATSGMVIKDVGSGKTATDLGIVTSGTVSTHVVGEPLDPIVTGATPLADLMGTRASAWIEQTGHNNDLTITATTNGADLNDLQITFVDDGTVVSPHGGETVEYDGDSSPKTLVVKIADGISTAADVVNAINNAQAAGTLPFTAELDLLEGKTGGTGVVFVTPSGETAGVTSGGSGENFDQDSGLQIVNSNQTYTLTFGDAVTVEDFLNTLNGSDAGVLAAINSTNNGIDIRSRVSGCNFGIGENGGCMASQLGVRTFTGTTALDGLNFGSGINRARDQIVATAQCDFDTENSSVLFTAVNTGSEWDGYTIQFVDNESAASADGLTFDAEAKTLTFEISDGTTTAGDIVAMLNKNSDARTVFNVSLPAEDGKTNDGSGLITTGAWTTSREAATTIDFTITRADGVEFGVDLGTAETIGDVIDLINNNETNCSSGSKIRAQLAAYGNGIELIDETTGTGTFTITRSKVSTAAIDLGLIPEGEESAAASSSITVGEAQADSVNANSSLVFHAKTPGTWASAVHVLFRDTGTQSVNYDKDSQQLVIDFDSATTTAADIKAMVEADPTASAVFSVDYPTSDPPSDGSGIFAPTSLDVAMTATPAKSLTSSDSNPLEVKGVFTALLRLQKALETSDEAEMSRAIAMLDDTTTQLEFVRAEVGSREQSLDTLKSQLGNEDIELQTVLSSNYDADIAEVMSKLALQETVYSASMKAMAMISNMSLIDYL